MDYFTDVMFEASKHIKCGLDLEFVSRDGDDWFELGSNRIDYEYVDLDYLSDYVISLKLVVGEFESTPANFATVAKFSEWLVIATALVDDGKTFDLVLASESLTSGEVSFDGRVLAAHLDALVSAKAKVLTVLS